MPDPVCTAPGCICMSTAAEKAVSKVLPPHSGQNDCEMGLPCTQPNLCGQNELAREAQVGAENTGLHLTVYSRRASRVRDTNTDCGQVQSRTECTQESITLILLEEGLSAVCVFPCGGGRSLLGGKWSQLTEHTSPRGISFHLGLPAGLGFHYF